MMNISVLCDSGHNLNARYKLFLRLFNVFLVLYYLNGVVYLL